MRTRTSLPWPALLCGLMAAGCSHNPYLAAQTNGAAPEPPIVDPAVQQAAASADGADLFAELAQAQQRIQLLQDELMLLRRRLRDTASQLQEVQRSHEDAERQLQAMRSSIQRGGGATITANNSLRPDLPAVELTGIEVRRDGDVVRVELPADQLFPLGAAQLLPTAPALLDQIAELIQRDYPQQMIGLEGHTDGMPTSAINGHTLGAAQAVAVFDVLTQRGRLPAQQLFVVAHGSNHPLVSNATPAGRAKNRRIEIVIYPETTAAR